MYYLNRAVLFAWHKQKHHLCIFLWHAMISAVLLIFVVVYCLFTCHVGILSDFANKTPQATVEDLTSQTPKKHWGQMQLQQWSINVTCLDTRSVCGKGWPKTVHVDSQRSFSPVLDEEHLKRQREISKRKQLPMTPWHVNFRYKDLFLDLDDFSFSNEQQNWYHGTDVLLEKISWLLHLGKHQHTPDISLHSWVPFWRKTNKFARNEVMDDFCMKSTPQK